MSHHYNILTSQNQIFHQSDQSLLGKCPSFKRQLNSKDCKSCTQHLFASDSQTKNYLQKSEIHDPYNSKSVMEVEGNGCVLASKEICLL